MPASPNQPPPVASSPAEQPAPAASLAPVTPRRALNWALVLLPLAYLWVRLVNNLRLEWSTDPQYSYGWFVPVLIVCLIVRQWKPARVHRPTGTRATGHGPEATDQRSAVSNQQSAVQGQPSGASAGSSALCALPSVLGISAALAFLYLPTRLIEEATPEWRPIQWSLGLIAVGLTLGAIYLAKGRSWLSRLAFPICFFLVAIPWPTLIESPVIQEMSRFNAAIVVEVMGILGVPAMPHGNVIQVATGVVGINEACSGIRSLQSSIMIALFLGAWYNLKPSRRWFLVPIGFAFAMVFNVCRMSLLTYVAAQKGVDAISQYHDPAGASVAVACFIGMWVVAWASSRKKSEASTMPSGPVLSSPSFASPFLFSAFCVLLCLWLAVVELGVQLWYHTREAHLAVGPAWSLDLPTGNPTFKPITIDEKTKYLLRFDEGKEGGWQEADGTQWQGSYFAWFPGRVAGYLAKRHTPEICMTAVGAEMRSGPDLTMVNVNGIKLPIRRYVFATKAGPLQVFHCRWEAGAAEESYVKHDSARFNLVRAIWAGRGNHGQKVLEFVAAGYDDPDRATEALVGQLEKLIKVQKPEVRGRRAEVGGRSRPSSSFP